MLYWSCVPFFKSGHAHNMAVRKFCSARHVIETKHGDPWPHEASTSCDPCRFLLHFPRVCGAYGEGQPGLSNLPQGHGNHADFQAIKGPTTTRTHATGKVNAKGGVTVSWQKNGGAQRSCGAQKHICKQRIQKHSLVKCAEGAGQVG